MLAGVAGAITALLLPYCGLLYWMGPEIVTRSRVVGEYNDDPSNGHENLVLKQDGTYSYTFTPKDGPAFTHAGTWSFSFGVRYCEVVLDNFAPKFPGADPQNRTWRLPVEEDWGMIRLWTSDRVRQFYLGAGRY